MKRIGFAVVAAVAVAACQTDRPLHAPLTADIQDANSGGSNEFFFWLPPIRQQQPDADQVFSKLVRPEVMITEEGPADPGATQTQCRQGALIRAFSGSAIGISAAEYHVNWHTNEDVLRPECKYRITVVAGGDVLGFAEIDVVNSGKGLKDVDTGEFIALLDDRTLPIKFFVGTGSLCGDVDDCGEGVARGGENTTIVTTSGRAGVFIPADALDPGVEVRITVESVDDDRGEFECIPNLFRQFPGTADVADNACYDYHAEQISPPTDQTGRFTFQKNVTVGICPDVVANDLDDPTRDLIQIFQFDAGANPVALKNVPAPFLRCDPNFSPNFGARRSILGDLARAFASLLTPRPLFASSNRMMLDIGTGGETDGFSRFTWGLQPAERIE